MKKKKKIEIPDGGSKTAEILEFDVILALCDVMIATYLSLK